MCPGHYHDMARCPAVRGDCDVRLRNNAAIEMDDVVSAFQTAFDDEDDAAFAELCQQHDQPLVRGESEPFTYPDDALGIGLRAQYAGLAHSDSHPAEMRGALAEARGVLSSLQSAAAAAGAGGAGAPLTSSLNLGPATSWTKFSVGLSFPTPPLLLARWAVPFRVVSPSCP
ncbi:hypothetical protein CYMTET_21206 [Cymbomonas tetramitiformis]|uniref:Uncharacterized protein n=1 Tax=Cymbomonas tetramitiformis TaxID=36881 RepID=A0AAE0G3U8_9CHLO|nr:hypothetical protein CYMTET_21206 [Cymbomonas tetramitiformis]